MAANWIVFHERDKDHPEVMPVEFSYSSPLDHAHLSAETMLGMASVICKKANEDPTVTVLCLTGDAPDAVLFYLGMNLDPRVSLRIHVIGVQKEVQISDGAELTKSSMKVRCARGYGSVIHVSETSGSVTAALVTTDKSAWGSMIDRVGDSMLSQLPESLHHAEITLRLQWLVQSSGHNKQLELNDENIGEMLAMADVVASDLARKMPEDEKQGGGEPAAKRTFIVIFCAPSAFVFAVGVRMRAHTDTLRDVDLYVANTNSHDDRLTLVPIPPLQA